LLTVKEYERVGSIEETPCLDGSVQVVETRPDILGEPDILEGYRITSAQEAANNMDILSTFPMFQKHRPQKCVRG